MAAPDDSPPPRRRTSRWATNLSPRGNVVLGALLLAGGLALAIFAPPPKLRVFGALFVLCGAALLAIGLAGFVKE